MKFSLSRSGSFIAIAVIAIGAGLSCSNDADDISRSPTPESTANSGKNTTGTVVSVIDGITVDVDVGGDVLRVRYLGLDLPLSIDQGVLDRALEFNRFLAQGRRVELEAGSVDADEQGRLLRYVYVGGEMANRAVLSNGYATVSPFPESFVHRAAFQLEEEAAKQGGRGLWDSAQAAVPTPTASQSFSGGTLPAPPSTEPPNTPCDSTGTPPMVKGNVDARTGDRVYHVPGSLLYTTVVISEADGDRWFCSENEAEAAGWKRSKQ
jgi:micrococcal nuclease